MTTQVTLVASWLHDGDEVGMAACAQLEAAASELWLAPPTPPNGSAGDQRPLRLQLRFTPANLYSSCKALWEVGGVPREAWAQ